MLSALTPVLIYRGLNLDNISVGDGPFSDGNGQHIHYISERAQGRQPKKGKSENNFGGVEFDRGIGQKLGLSYEILRSRPV